MRRRSQVLAPDPAVDVPWTAGHRVVALVRAAGPRLELEKANRTQREEAARGGLGGKTL
jgi:hypothetical protein